MQHAGSPLWFFSPDLRSVNRRVNKYLDALHWLFVRSRPSLNVKKCCATPLIGRPSFVYPNFRRFQPDLKIGSEEVSVSDKVVFQERFHRIRIVDYDISGTKLICGNLRTRGGLSQDVRLSIY